MRSVLIICAVVCAGVSFIGPLYSHCEIPCGIYDDDARVEMMKEHTRTIEKSMNYIIDLQKQESIDRNQLVRWIVNKEDHANKLQDIVTQYFLTQRVPPVEEDGDAGYGKYNRQLRLLHQIMVQAMKAKQTTDVKHVKKLRQLIDEFHDVYFHE